MKDSKFKVNAWTDGACSGNPGVGGWGVVIEADGHEQMRISGYELESTNNRMELTAMLKAITSIISMSKKSDKKRADVVIMSDSAYVVNSISNGWLLKWSKNGWRTKQGAVKNRELWEKTNELLSKARRMHCNIKLVKVKGHAGNEMNELADRLAVEARMYAEQR